MRRRLSVWLLAEALALATTLPLMAEEGPADAIAKEAARAAATAVMTVARNFHDLVKQQLPHEAMALVAQAGVDQLALRGEAEKVIAFMADGMSSGARDFTVIEAQVIGDAAVVVIDQKRKDGQPVSALDAIYLLGENGRWLVLLVSPQDRRLRLPQGQRRSLAAVKAWYEAREPVLQQGRDAGNR